MTIRTKFLKATARVALIPLVTLPVHRSMAAEKVPIDGPTAKALKYVEDANNPRWGGCALSQNRLVAGPYWCADWETIQS